MYWDGKDKFLEQEDGTRINYYNYAEDLTYIKDSEYDINNVYISKTPLNFKNKINTKDLILIWNRNKGFIKKYIWI